MTTDAAAAAVGTPARPCKDLPEANPYMRRDIFTEEHEMFRAQVRRFVETEIVPKIDGWNRAGMSDRESWRKLGAAGFLAPNAPAECGGVAVACIYDAIVIEEMARVRAHSLMMGLHSDICLPYPVSFGS